MRVMSLFVLSMLTMITNSYAFDSANRLVNEAYQAYVLLQENARYMNDDEIAKATQLTKQLQRLAIGDSTTPNQGISCVARDNDGRNPWMLAISNDGGFSKKKINKTTIGNLNDCEEVARAARSVGSSYLACVTKDNDGRNPWVLAMINNTNATHIRYSTVANKANCLEALNNAVNAGRGQIVTCGSRDSDGRTPFVKIKFDKNGQVTKGTDSYNSFANCIRDL